MLKQLNKQLLTLALVASIASPVTAMEPTADSGGWFGWKSAVAGAALVIGGVVVSYKYLKNVQLPKVFMQPEDTEMPALEADTSTAEQPRRPRPKGPAGRRLPSRKARKATTDKQQETPEAPEAVQKKKPAHGINLYGVSQEDLNKAKLNPVR